MNILLLLLLYNLALSSEQRLLEAFLDLSHIAAANDTTVVLVLCWIINYKSTVFYFLTKMLSRIIRKQRLFWFPLRKETTPDHRTRQIQTNAVIHNRNLQNIYTTTIRITNHIRHRPPTMPQGQGHRMHQFQLFQDGQQQSYY